MLPLRVGLVGTGYAARLRAESFQADSRSQLIAIAGHNPAQTTAFCQAYGSVVAYSWQELIERSDLDVVVISNVNRDHSGIVRAALEAKKHVVVEYPLALDIDEAKRLVELAKKQDKLLHVEHIELLSGIHSAVKQSLAAIGTPFYVSYTSLNSQRPAPQKWTYYTELFGFPFIGAVSRFNRLIDLFGKVTNVHCQARFWGRIDTEDSYTSCICTAQLQFANELIAEVVYGKGEAIWKSERCLDIQGEKGAVLIDGEQGLLVQADQTFPLDMGTRRGLFAKDTTMVLDFLTTGARLYVTPESSLYALQVADAARRSAETGQSISLV